MRTLENAKSLREETANKSSKGERKQLFHELLLNKEIDRDKVIDLMAIELEERHTPNLGDDEFKTLRKSCAKSVSNFISKSFRPSTAKATYNGDPEYGTEHEFSRKGNLLTIKPRKK